MTITRHQALTMLDETMHWHTESTIMMIECVDGTREWDDPAYREALRISTQCKANLIQHIINLHSSIWITDV